MASTWTCSALYRTHKDLTYSVYEVDLYREVGFVRYLAPVLTGFCVSWLYRRDIMHHAFHNILMNIYNNVFK